MIDNLLDRLRSFWAERRLDIHTRFNRTLPFGDYVVDRWEKARLLGFGEGASVYDSALVLGKVEVGAHSWIGPGVVLDGSGGLSIGAYCSISAGVQIYSHDSVAWALSGGEAPYEYSPTSIGDRCYIGPNTIIARGVRVGNGCIVGAGSIVLDSIADGSKAAGAPCRVVGLADVGRHRDG